MTLVKLALLYSKGKVTVEDVKRELEGIDIFEVNFSKDELVDTVYTIGDYNSWFDVVSMLVNEKVITQDDYLNFKELVDSIVKENK